ncbi:MAG: ATP-binding protein [Desulfovermiculus sp.]
MSKSLFNSLGLLYWQIALPACLLILVIIAAMTYSLWASQEKAMQHITRVEASMQAIQHDLLGHQKLRDALGQNQQTVFDQAISHFQQSQRLVAAMLGGEKDGKNQITPVRDTSLRQELRKLADQQGKFINVATLAWEMQITKSDVTGSSLEPGLQDMFFGLVSQFDVMQSRLHSMIEKDLSRFHITQFVLLGVIFILAAATVFMFLRFIRQRDRAEQKVQTQKEELRQSEDALRNLFENSPIGLFRTNSNGQVLQVNPAMIRMLRIDSGTKKQIYAQNLANALYVHTEQRKELLNKLEAEGQVEKFEFQGWRADGTWAWFSMDARISERPPNQPYRIDGFVSEITQRKQAQESVQHLNRVLKAIRNINQLIMSEKDHSRLIEQGCRILVQSRGFEAAMIILTDKSNQPVLYAQEGFSNALPPFEQSLEQGQLPQCCQHAMSEGREVCFIDKPSATCRDCPLARDCMHCDTLCIALQYSGTVYGFLTVALPVGQGNSQDEQFLLHELATDIAYALHGLYREEKTRKAEEEKKAAEKQLIQAQKMEAIGRLAGGVAHDFNNMLGVIMGYADLALTRFEGNDSLRYPLEQIRQAAGRSADLTRQLLAFSRKQLTQPQVLDLNQEIEKQRIMLARLIGENLKLKFIPDSDLWPVEVDPSQIDQILANLVINARDAIVNVGTITLETMNVTLDEAYSNTHIYAVPGDYVCLMVSDNGMGMDRQTQEQIFDPFFTTKQSEHGTGLGLSTVYGIVKQNKGMIHVYSEPGKGTTFKLYFPRSQGPISTAKPEQTSSPMLGQETILLVEDEEMVLELTQTVLEEQGYKVLAARSPQQAQVVAREHADQIQVLITDVVLPEMNGKELRAAIEDIIPSVKTLFMSGYTENVIAQRGMYDPQFFFIQKPFSAAGLGNKLRQLLSA